MTQKEKILVGKLLSYAKGYISNINMPKSELKPLIKEIEKILLK